MPSSQSSGSQTCVLDNEHTLATITTAGDYQLTLDMNAAAAGDWWLIRQKLKVRSSGTTRLLDVWTVDQVTMGAELVFSTPRQAIVNELVYTIEQKGGTGRAIPWEVVNVSSTDVLLATSSEPVVVPDWSSTLQAKLDHMFLVLRNKRTETSSVETIYQDDASTVYATSSKADDGTTFTSGEITTA